MFAFTILLINLAERIKKLAYCPFVFLPLFVVWGVLGSIWKEEMDIKEHACVSKIKQSFLIWLDHG